MKPQKEFEIQNDFNFIYPLQRKMNEYRVAPYSYVRQLRLNKKNDYSIPNQARNDTNNIKNSNDFSSLKGKRENTLISNLYSNSLPIQEEVNSQVNQFYLINQSLPVIKKEDIYDEYEGIHSLRNQNLKKCDYSPEDEIHLNKFPIKVSTKEYKRIYDQFE